MFIRFTLFGFEIFAIDLLPAAFGEPEFVDTDEVEEPDEESLPPYGFSPSQYL